MSVTKTAGGVLLALLNITGSAAPTIGTPVANASSIGVAWSVDFGRLSTTAFTNSPYIILQGSNSASPLGTGDWVDLDVWQPAIGSSVAGLALTTLSSSGSKTLPMSNTTGYAVQNIVFINDTTFANSEFARVAAVTASTSLTTWENLVNGHAVTTTTVYNQAEIYASDASFNYNSYRVIVDSSNNAVNFAVQARLNYTNLN